jgi:hypothetical protein
VPTATDSDIEELCGRIRLLCSGLLTSDVEAELRGLARELRLAIQHHVWMAKSSLATKQAAIAARDPDRHLDSG